MALQESGAISFSEIEDEYGGAAPTSFSEYYREGTYVGDYANGNNANIPTSGSISISDFYGTQKRDAALYYNGTAYTSLSATSVAIGDAHDDRVVLIAHASRYGGTNVTGSITAGGNTHTMTAIGNNDGSVGQEVHTLLYANVPDGTTANITLTNSGGSENRWSACSFVPTNTTPTQTWGTSSGSLSVTKTTIPESSIMAIGMAAYGSADIGGMTSDISMDNNTRGLGGETAVGVATTTSHTFSASGYNITAAWWE
jgi:hypothetical protein